MKIPIRTLEDPALRRPSVEIRTGAASLVIDALWDSLPENAVGLAAPQIGYPVRVCVVRVGGVKWALINPVVVSAKGFSRVEEGCLSIPGKVFNVLRANIVKVRAVSPEGVSRVYKGHDVLARALQHEIDHLDGILVDQRAREL